MAPMNKATSLKHQNHLFTRKDNSKFLLNLLNGHHKNKISYKKKEKTT